MLKQILILLAIVPALAVVVIAAFHLLQKKLIFFPQETSEINRKAFSRYEIKIDHNGVALHGWFLKGDISRDKPLLIYYGGNGEDISGNLWELERFQAGSFLFMNYRGYGDSQGKPSEKAFFKDALFVLDHIAQRENINLKDIVLLGRSLGSGVAVHIASQRKVRGVILITPFDSLANTARHHYPWLPIDRLLKHRFDSIEHAPGIMTPALFIMGDRDEVIPLRNSLNLVEAWGGPAESMIVKGAAHNDISAYAEYWTAISRFLESLSKEG